MTSQTRYGTSPLAEDSSLAEGKMNPGGSFDASSYNTVTAVKEYRRVGNHFRRYRWAESYTRGRAVLDVGCGYGLGAIALGGTFREYLGVDVDSSALIWSKRNIADPKRNISFVSSTDLPADGCLGKFDVAILFEVLEHVVDPSDLIQGIIRHLKPSGIGLFSTPNGNYSRGDPNLFRSSSHVTEYSPQEFLSIVTPWFESVGLAGERRLDGLDSLALRRLPTKADRPAANTQQGGREARSLKARGFQFVARHLNGPLFWQIEGVSDPNDIGLRYSTLLAIARNPVKNQIPEPEPLPKIE